MSEKKIVVPKGMLKAANEELDRWSGGPNSRLYTVEDRPNIALHCLEAAIRWQLPRLEKVLSEVLYDCLHSLSQPSMQMLNNGERLEYLQKHVLDEVRRMFLAPEPEIDEIWMPFVRNAPAEADSITIYTKSGTVLAEIDLEVFRRGQKSKS